MKRVLSILAAGLMGALCLLSVSANSGFNLANTIGKVFDTPGYAYYGEGESNEQKLSHATDKDMSTGWQYKNTTGQDAKPMEYKDGVFLGVLFDEYQTVEEVQIYFELGSRPEASTDGYILQYSINGTTWRDFGEDEGCEYTYGTEPLSGATEEIVCDVITFDEIEVKGIRVVMYKMISKWSPKIFEFEVYKAESAVTSADIESSIHFESEESEPTPEVSDAPIAPSVEEVSTPAPVETPSVQEPSAEPPFGFESTPWVIAFAVGVLATLVLAALVILRGRKK